MKDFYKKLMKMSVDDAEEIARDHETDAIDEMAMQLYQSRVQHWHMKAMEERQLDLPDDPASMFK
ncbi:hypothetical protein [Halococcus saccharolyticus]|uniref:Uncharacterized protein n=1 Tax=Halococcus saccharolyticus DSM 5350 TaxID=1227455 RepID=M0MBC3_9EURY|nr:hypothetical protein [Halococcus saccharolyticus]EMA42648.1 hypothetical protein C449_15938 [Halococcus saccharolyticus DSM 5350]